MILCHSQLKMHLGVPLIFMIMSRASGHSQRLFISTYHGIFKFSRAKFSNIGFWDALGAPFIFHHLFYLNLLSVINTKLWLN